METNTNQEQQTEIQTPNIELPKGGGAIRSMGETFQPNAFSGTGSYSIPVPITPARGFEPELSIDYNSGAGNSEWGIGFSLSLPKISRRTEKGIPKYDDSDIFIAGTGELTPKLVKKNGELVRDIRTESLDNEKWNVYAYLPRIEGAFSQIEQWINAAGNDFFWQIISKDNTIDIFGKKEINRIYNPEDHNKIFEWLIEESIDAAGNKIKYAYKEENKDNVPDDIYQQGHSYNNRYIQSVKYGNFFDENEKEQFAFEILFDYGEYDLPGHNAGKITPSEPVREWAYRPDPFSSYRSGFEIRTCRLCRNILLIHHFENELGAPCLVKSVSAHYQQAGKYGKIDSGGLSIMKSIVLTGYIRKGSQAADQYETQEMPPLEFTFSQFKPPAAPEFKELKMNGHSIPGYLDNVNFQPVDLDSEGIPGLLYNDRNTILYLEPEGDGNYSKPKPPERFPVDRDFQSVSLVDLEGNGELELVVEDSTRAGFYQKENSGAWGNYRAFDSYPNDNSTPSMERADLDANGKTDLIQVRENNILVWPSKGKAGYAPATKVSRESELPLPKQEYKEEYVGFANIFGDGLSHRVKITRGSVECWPALGDGKFGEKITLGNAPAFEENFDIDRLFLTDIDGSGTADLVYVYDDRVELYLNRGGNSFSGAVTVSLPGQYSNTDRVGFSDVLGNGTTCLVFTKIAPDPKHYYYDFVGETIIGEKPQKSLKPYLLNQIDNNLGAVTRVQYCSSVKFYLEDKKAGRPWITKQHFPVQVVEEVISIDRVSGSRYTNRFKYHDGYYDTEERQFKGFGYVESWDTETFEEYAKNNGLQNVPVETVDPGLYVPPVYTRTWHHTGAIIREGVISRHYKDRYFQGDPHAHDFPDSILQPDIHTSDPETKRQAYAALSGSVMRREVYARAGGELEKNPYTVEESNFEVSLLQERADSEFAVFKVNPRESITYDYERDPADPRVEQEFTLEVDPHCGEITTSCAVILPRRPNSDPDITVYPEQQELKATAAYNSFINTPDRHGSRWRGVPCREQEFEIFGLDSEGKLYFSYDDLVPVKDAVKEPVPYEGDLDQGVLQARQLTWNRHFYWDEAQEAVLPAGEISSRALLHHSENAAFTKEFIAEVMGPRLSDHTIETHGGYLFDQETGYWWNKGLTQYYLEDAASFYMPAETMNSFADPSSSLYLKTKLEYDNYYLAPVKATQYLDEDEGIENVVSAEIDYVTFQPKQHIDINGNVSQALFDPLGQVIVTTLLGSENGEPIGGMRLYPYNGEPAEYEKQDDASFMAILEAPEKYLQGAASFFYYNLYAWQNDTQPVCSINLVRKDYYKTNRETTDFSCQTLIHYADGFGRDLEEKLETEPGKAFTRDAQLKLKRDKNNHPVDEYTAHRWIVSGKTVYNNKGEVCKEYLPYFSNTPLFESQQEIVEEGLVPPPTVTHYDPLTRVTRVDTPKGFFSKVEFNPWEEKHYDENDTVKDSEYYIKFMEEYPPEPTRELEDEKNALEKAAVFYDTPAIKVLDSRGMVFLDIQTNIEGANEEKRQLLSYYETDIQGRQTMSIDPRLYLSNQTKGTDYYNFKYRYIMGAEDPEDEEENTPVYTDSADGGVQKHFSNIFGNQLWSYSPRDYCQLISYDRLQRKSALRVKKISRQDEEPITSFDDFNLVEVFTYGESQPEAQQNNLRGQIKELKDLSGIVTNSAYSMQESVLETSRQMAEDYKTPLNWNKTPIMEEDIYNSKFTYNALSMALTQTTPDDSLTTNTYNQSGQLDTVHVRFKDNSEQQVVKHIEYDAKGQRETIEYGNGIITSYMYEPTTLRLTGLLSTKSNGNGNKTVQDIDYTFDPVGNVTRSWDHTFITVFNNNQKVDPLSDYTYDALYRLVKANGRQHPGITADTFKNNIKNNDFKQTKFNQIPSVNDTEQLENYREEYTYDDSGNLIHKKHTADSSSWKKETPVEDNNNRLKNQEYDDSGNLRELDINSTMELSFNCCENLVKAGIIERPDQLDDCDYYVYDSDEMRTRKVSERFANGGAVTQIEEKIYIGNFEIKRIKSVNAEGEEYLNHERQTLRVMDDDTCVTIFHNIKRDNQHQDKEGTQQCRFQLANHLGSISLELDNETQLISYEEYFPYGGTALTVGKNETEVRQKDYRYSGKERDDSTGMYYYGARYYAPWQARWLKPDPAGTVDGLNLYAFVGGNPVTNQELDGNMYCEKTKHGADILNIKKKVGSFLDQEEIETGRMALYNRVKDLTGTDAETTEYQEPLYGALRKFLKYSKNWVKVTDSESFREITTMKTHKFIINVQLNQKDCQGVTTIEGFRKEMAARSTHKTENTWARLSCTGKPKKKQRGMETQVTGNFIIHLRVDNGKKNKLKGPIAYDAGTLNIHYT